MTIDYLIDKFQDNSKSKALVWNNQSYTYGILLNKIKECEKKLKCYRITMGMTVEIKGDCSPYTIAMLIALIKNRCIIIPTDFSSENNRTEIQTIGEIQHIIEIDRVDKISHSRLSNTPKNPLYLKLIKEKSPGLVLFSSGSTGKPKGVVHNFQLLLNKYMTPKTAKNIINFLLFDHIGGINTIFHSLFSGGCLINLTSRNPFEVCKAIMDFKANILPTTPSFLNMLLITKAYDKFDLRSLQLITYGSEPMPESTLIKIHEILPSIRLAQTYGLSEVGILHVRSKSSDSILMKIDEKGYKTRVKDGFLEIKSQSAMLGYLNYTSPFTIDGWFKTGDKVIKENEYIKILGRDSDIINIGGKKVYPQQVENIILMMEEVVDVVVHSEKHLILGQIVTAVITVKETIDNKQFRKKLRDFCKKHLSSYMVPQKITFSKNNFYNKRFKKVRNSK